ncbi:MAG: hypothetical protein QW835_06130 [Candidatus Hadarchaeum sp.]|uniref:hypothetical protein n=1 Tax=Candidatus Hadarchaeum sp. TaxID=2883567 RepID=UPI003170C58C
MDSDGEYLVVGTIYEQSVKVYRVAELSSHSAPAATVGGPGGMNLPQAAIVSNGHLFVADSGFNRVLVWKSTEETLTGKWPPDVILVRENLEDRRPRIRQNSFCNPSGICFDGSYLWIGEFKFSKSVKV